MSPAPNRRPTPAAIGQHSTCRTTGASPGPSVKANPAADWAATCPRVSAGTANPFVFQVATPGAASCCSSTACTSAAMYGSTASTSARDRTALSPLRTISARIYTPASNRTLWLCAWITRTSPTCAGTRDPAFTAIPGSSTPARSTSTSGEPASPRRKSRSKTPRLKSPRA